jgi:hypothetical protein
MSTTLPTPRRYPGRFSLWLGLAVALLGLVAYFVMLSRGDLTFPWYLPLSAVLGVLLVGFTIFRGLTVFRILAFILVVVLAGLEGFFLFATRLPAYTGPVAVGKPFPAFSTLRADGKPFTQANLQGEKGTVMVFFRGRW